MKTIFIFLMLAGPMAWAQVRLRSLVNVSIEKIAMNSKTPSVFIMFQKDCLACKKQVRDLSCLNHGQWPVRLVGVFSPEKDLRTEYQSFNSSLPAFYGDQDFIRYFKINQKITPQILISHKKKRIKKIGLTACKDILKILLKQREL